MVRIRRCRARKPLRPKVCNGCGRQIQNAGGAVSPGQGQLAWILAGAMNTAPLTRFLAQVSAAPRREFIVMVVDGASSQLAKAGAEEQAAATPLLEEVLHPVGPALRRR
jgi:hypothetical protein